MIMSENNTKRLIEAAPSLYGNTFYFECGDGWFDILLKASIDLQNQINSYPKHIREDIVAIQVKEKYGSLRFYLSYYSEELDEIIQKAEESSACTCETCGKPGKIFGSFWLYAACDEHVRDADKIHTNESSGGQ